MRRLHLASFCVLCKQQGDDLDHILWHCQYTKQLWAKVCNLFSVYAIFVDFKSAIEAIGHCSTYVKQLRQATTEAMMVSTWKHRNRICFEDFTPSITTCKNMIRDYAARYSKGCMEAHMTSWP